MKNDITVGISLNGQLSQYKPDSGCECPFCMVNKGAVGMWRARFIVLVDGEFLKDITPMTLEGVYPEMSDARTALEKHRPLMIEAMALIEKEVLSAMVGKVLKASVIPDHCH